MKKLLLIFALFMGLTVSIQARDTYSRNITDLPQAAQVVLNKNFKAGLSLIKIDKSTFGTISDYEVILSDGTEIEFDRNGNWEKIETAYDKSVPSSMVPQPIRDYVKSNHKGSNIIGIEKDRKKIEIELNNGLDLEFTPSGEFIKYDR